MHYNFIKTLANCIIYSSQMYIRYSAYIPYQCAAWLRGAGAKKADSKAKWKIIENKREKDKRTRGFSRFFKLSRRHRGTTGRAGCEQEVGRLGLFFRKAWQTCHVIAQLKPGLATELTGLDEGQRGRKEDGLAQLLGRRQPAIMTRAVLRTHYFSPPFSSLLLEGLSFSSSSVPPRRATGTRLFTVLRCRPSTVKWADEMGVGLGLVFQHGVDSTYVIVIAMATIFF